MSFAKTATHHLRARARTSTLPPSLPPSSLGIRYISSSSNPSPAPSSRSSSQGKGNTREVSQTRNMHTSTVAGAAESGVTERKKKRKILIIGAGFIGSYVAKALIADSRNQVILGSRKPEKLYEQLRPLGSQLLPPISLDITSPSSLSSAISTSKPDAVISLVGILTGTERDFVELQEKGGENVARACREGGVGRVVGVSALGIDGGETPYARTKLAMEKSILQHNPSATIIRPSLVFGPGDSFFTRFATLARYLPFLPLFGGGTSRFQPIYVGDLAKAVEIASRDEGEVKSYLGGKVVEGGGPDVFSYKQLMQITLAQTGLSSTRLLLPIPFWIGMIQAFFLEKLPLPELLKLTRDQVKQLKNDNKESGVGVSVADMLGKFQAAGIRTDVGGDSGSGGGKGVLKSVFDIIPTYIKPKDEPGGGPVSGKRRHGRDYSGGEKGLEEIKALTEKARVEREKKVGGS